MSSLLQKTKIILISAGLVAVSLTFLQIAPAYAADCPPGTSVKDSITCGTNCAAGTANCDTTADSADTLTQTVVNVINVLSLIVGAVAVIMIIIAGFRFISSGGNEQTIKSAKTTLTFAIIGLIIVAVAQIVAHFVLSNTSGTSPPASPPPFQGGT